ncbi:MAG: hypothetical protein ACM3VV_08085 [Deltaproteobacteria bacterium]
MIELRYKKPDRIKKVIQYISDKLTKFKFVGKISKMGNNKVIWIPKEFHDQITELEGKQE